MPSRLSTAFRFAHADITDSGSLDVDFDFEDFPLAFVETSFDFVDDFAFFFWGLKSSSSESTLLGIGQRVIPGDGLFLLITVDLASN